MNALVSLENINSLSYEDIAKLTGQSTGQTGSLLPNLTINRTAENDEGQAMPVGQYTISTAETGQVFSRIGADGSNPVKFRPFVQAYRYMLYDPETDKYTNKSVLFQDFREDAPDEKGGNKCGKIARKQLEGAPAALVEAQKNIKCQRFLYGVVSFDGVDLNGKEVSIVNQPVLWRSGGASFMPVGDALDQLSKAKRPMLFHNLLLVKPKREKQGSNVYYTPVINVDFENVLSMTQEDIDVIGRFRDTIKFENEQVMDKFKSATSKAPKKSDLDDSAALKDIFDADFDEAA